MEKESFFINCWYYDPENNPIQWQAEDYCHGLGELYTPIPITEDILKLNGFTKEICSVSNEWSYPNVKEGYLSYSIQNRKLHRSGPKSCGSICVEYVHELQHVLYLFGLQELCREFKIK